jgi:acyl-CoA reductase-like NAD-dependent aldehyde dehydrogenase
MTAESTPTPTVKMVIGGAQVDAADGRTFDVVSPVNGSVIARVPMGGQ